MIVWMWSAQFPSLLYRDWKRCADNNILILIYFLNQSIFNNFISKNSLFIQWTNVSTSKETKKIIHDPIISHIKLSSKHAYLSKQSEEQPLPSPTTTTGKPERWSRSPRRRRSSSGRARPLFRIRLSGDLLIGNAQARAAHSRSHLLIKLNVLFFLFVSGLILG